MFLTDLDFVLLIPNRVDRNIARMKTTESNLSDIWAPEGGFTQWPTYTLGWRRLESTNRSLATTGFDIPRSFDEDYRPRKKRRLYSLFEA